MTQGHLSKIPLSEKVLGVVVQGWKVGKAALALLVIGTISILAFSLAMANHHLEAITFLGLGAALVGFVAYQFYIEAIVPAKRASTNLHQNAALLNVVQDAALLLTGLITEINDFSLYHAKEIVDTVDAVKIVVEKIPFVNTVLGTDYFTKPEQLVRKIREFAEVSRSVIVDIQNAIAQSDGAKIKSHLEGLRHLKELIESELLPG
jgi:hypothetical protein